MNTFAPLDFMEFNLLQMKPQNVRFKAWFDLMKQTGIIENQGILANYLKSEKGRTVSQAFISAIYTGTSAIPDNLLIQLEELFPFTSGEYFSHGVFPMVDFQKLKTFLLKNLKLSQRQFVTRLNHKEITEPRLSGMNNQSPPEYWQIVFDWFNDQSGLSINVEMLLEAEKQIGIITPEFAGKNEVVERFFEIKNALKQLNYFERDKDFCEAVNLAPSQLSNMLNPVIQQDITKDLIVSLLKAYPKVNPDYLLLGKGELFRGEFAAFPLLMEISEIVKRIERKIDSSED